MLRQSVLVKGRNIITRLGTFKFVFTITSSGYCAIHWLATHSFSAYVLAGALVSGAVMAMAVRWLAKWFHPSSSALSDVT